MRKRKQWSSIVFRNSAVSNQCDVKELVNLVRIFPERAAGATIS